MVVDGVGAKENPGTICYSETEIVKWYASEAENLRYDDDQEDDGHWNVILRLGNVPLSRCFEATNWS